MPLENLKAHLIRCLNAPLILVKATLEPGDVKRTNDRSMTLYPFNQLDFMMSYGDFDNQIRYVVDGHFEMVLGQSGRPSKYIPQHREMPKDGLCRSSGYICLSNNKPQNTITKITHRCSDYNTDMASLLWTLTIINEHPLCIDPSFQVLTQELDVAGNSNVVAIPLNANMLRELLSEVWEQCPKTRMGLRNRIIAQNTMAKIATVNYIDEEAHLKRKLDQVVFDGYPFFTTSKRRPTIRLSSMYSSSESSEPQTSHDSDSSLEEGAAKSNTPH